MGAQSESHPWERRPREGPEAYAAFLAYRDVGAWRTHELTRLHLGKGPGYIKPIERWSARLDWRLRVDAWDARLQAERDKVAIEEAVKWERRRLQALEEGWQLCRTLRARLEQMLAIPPEAPVATPPEPADEPQTAIPEALTPPETARATSGRVPSRGNDLAVARLSKLIIDLEWSLLSEVLPPPGEINPLTATRQELDAYMAIHPLPSRPPRR